MIGIGSTKGNQMIFIKFFGLKEYIFKLTPFISSNLGMDHIIPFYEKLNSF